MVRNQITPTKAQMRKIPNLYESDDCDPVVHVRYFFSGRGAFYVTECDPSTMTFFGWAISPNGPDCDEWSYVTLQDLEEASSRRRPYGVERDLYFSSKPLSEACKQNGDPLPYDMKA